MKSRAAQSPVTRSPLHCAPLLALLLALPGCGEGSRASSAITAYDSAGVRVVVNSAPVWPEDEAWTFAAEPELVIGEVDGDAPYMLSGVRDAIRLSDGRIVIANGGSHELRVFDARGGFLESLGREGSGPGEFNNLNSLHLLPGDSLAVWDGLLRRLTVFAPDGSVGREQTFRALASFMPPVIGVFSDGTLLSSTGRRGATGAAREEYRDTLLWVRVRSDTTWMDVIGRSLGAEQMQLASEASATNYQVMFGRTAHAAGGRDRWFSGENGRYEIDVRNPAGALAAVIRRTVEPRPVRPEELAAARDRESRDRARADSAMRSFMAGNGGTFTPGARLEVDEIPHREMYPFFDRLLVDQQENLWVRDYMSAGEETQVWSVFDRAGRWLGEVETPRGIDVFRIGEDYLLGRARDALGVETVHLYRLDRPAVAAEPA